MSDSRIELVAQNLIEGAYHSKSYFGTRKKRRLAVESARIECTDPQGRRGTEFQVGYPIKFRRPSNAARNATVEVLLTCLREEKHARTNFADTVMWQDRVMKGQQTDLELKQNSQTPLTCAARPRQGGVGPWG